MTHLDCVPLRLLVAVGLGLGLLAPRVLADELPPANRVSAHHILIAVNAGDSATRRAAKEYAAKAILAQLHVDELSGAMDTFGALAQKHSDCPSKAKGGDLGWFGRGQMVAPFEAAAFSQPVGTSTLVETTFGYHILRVDARETAGSRAAPSETAPWVGKVEEALNGGNYTFARLAVGGGSEWIAAAQAQVGVGDTVKVPGGIPMKDFTSPTLKRTFETILFAKSIQVIEKAAASTSAPPPLLGAQLLMKGSNAVPAQPRFDPVKAVGAELVKKGWEAAERGDGKTAVGLLESAAERYGSASANYLLGAIYALGKVVPKDLRRAESYYRKAADKGDEDAQKMLRLLPVLSGDPAEAFASCLRVAESGDAHAQNMVARYYLNGDGTDKDVVEALRWARLSAANGDPRGQVLLAGMLRDGLAGEADPVEAMKWAAKAANQGDPDACHVLGDAYLEGRGVPSNRVEGAKWFRKGAERDNVPCQMMLGLVSYYPDKPGMPQDYYDAERHRWLLLAAESSVVAPKMIDVIKKQGEALTPEQRALARKLADEYRATRTAK